MKFFTILYLILSGITFANDNALLLTKALTNEVMNDDERHKLVRLVIRKNDDFLKVMEDGLEGVAAQRAQSLLSFLKEAPKEDEGKNRLGAAIGWFMEYQGNQMTAFPIVTKVLEKSSAQKSKLLLGDVLWKLEGESLHHAHSRNHFMDLLLVWPEGNAMNFEIRRNPNEQKISVEVERRKKFKLSVQLAKKG